MVQEKATTSQKQQQETYQHTLAELQKKLAESEALQVIRQGELAQSAPSQSPRPSAPHPPLVSAEDADTREEEETSISEEVETEEPPAGLLVNVLF